MLASEVCCRVDDAGPQVLAQVWHDSRGRLIMCARVDLAKAEIDASPLWALMPKGVPSIVSSAAWSRVKQMFK